ncbi:hypothetical protein ACLK1T_14535 [Escherichia coli]
MGYFSSDRTIKKYADHIWHIESGEIVSLVKNRTGPQVPFFWPLFRKSVQRGRRLGEYNPSFRKKDRMMPKKMDFDLADNDFFRHPHTRAIVGGGYCHAVWRTCRYY